MEIRQNLEHEKLYTKLPPQMYQEFTSWKPQSKRVN